MLFFQALELGGHPAHVGGRARLGHEIAIGTRRDGLLEVGYRMLGEDGIHPNPALAPAEVQRLQPAPHDGARGRLQGRGHRVFEIEDEPIGGKGESLGHHLLLAAGNEVQRAAHGQPF